MALEDPRLAFIDDNRNRVANSRRTVVFPDDHLVACRTAKPVVFIVFRRPFDDDVVDLVFHSLVLFQAVDILYIHEALQAAAFFCLVDLAIHAGCRRASARREHERIGHVVLAALEEFQRIQIHGFRFAGETDDDIRRQDQVGNALTGIVDEFHIMFYCIAPVHAAQELVVATLNGQVHVVDDLLAFSNGVDGVKIHNECGEFLEEPIPPCGACRQVMLETEKRFKRPMRVLLFGKTGIYELGSVGALLPLSFDASSML